MATRTQFPTSPAFDSHHPQDRKGISSVTSDQSFNNIIRMIRHGNRSHVQQIRHATFHALRRLGVARDKSKAIGRTPRGSDNVDIQSVVAWASKVQPGHRKAIQQLLAIDATACAR